jgi:hypothetical protein
VKEEIFEGATETEVKKMQETLAPEKPRGETPAGQLQKLEKKKKKKIISEKEEEKDGEVISAAETSLETL